MSVLQVAGQLSQHLAVSSCLITVRVVPRSSRNAVAGWEADGSIKIKVQTPPEDGRANREVCALLARTLGLPVAAVRLESGTRARIKVLHIEGLDLTDVRAKLPLS